MGLVLPIIPIQCKTGRQYNVILSSIADFQIQQTINSISLVYMKTENKSNFWIFLMISNARDETENINLINIVESFQDIFSFMHIF